jgi:uncharacterized membrane protein YfcA
MTLMHHLRQNMRLAGFLIALPIGTLGGLIGLGGAEFRLPVLVGVFGYSARHAVAINLAISLITVIAALAIRLQTLPVHELEPLLLPIVALTCGAVSAAFAGTALVGRLPEKRLQQIIVAFLTAIGLALIAEGFLPGEPTGLLPAHDGLRLIAGIGFGLLIGLVSSMLGVAGGELIIPTLLFAYGTDIRAAGTASLLISLPTVSVGLIRYTRRGAFQQRHDLTDTIAPMGVGSAAGALIGGLLAGIVPTALLKIGLGIILIASALNMFRHQRAN